MKYLATAFIVCAMVMLPMSLVPVHAATGCNLCIMELQTQGARGEEDQDFVVIANVSGTTVTASSSNPIRLQYYNGQGVASSSITISTTTIPKDQVYVLAASALTAMNSGVQTLPMSLYSGGGSLQLYRGTTVYDGVGWGNAVTAEGQSAPMPRPGATLARKQIDNMIQDTNNNSQDFYLRDLECGGQEISEIQPFVVDAIGQSIDAWIEIMSSAESKTTCHLVTKAGDMYGVAEEDLAASGLRVISRGTASDGQTVPLHLGEISGQIWLVALSEYAAVRVPIETKAYSNVENGQSYALVDGIWRRTYALTPGTSNVYASSGVIEDDPTACSTVRISEILPNPAGEDTGREWLEIVNESDQPARLESCIVVASGVEYRFLPDDMIGQREWRTVYDFYDNDQKPKSLSLRNSDSTLVILQRFRQNAASDVIQSFEYVDAPEGQSWARFIDGWRWVTPTPDADNALTSSTDGGSGPTEFPADASYVNDSDQQAPVPAVQVSITELLPNPAAPATDDTDEFVELFNESDEPVSLRGFKLQTGNSYNYSFTFNDQVIPARGYMVVSSGESSISLANSGGRARLVSSAGEVVSETVSYVDAPEGQSWALVDGVWKWTASSTPGVANAFKTPVLTALSKAKTSTSSKSSGTVKSAAKTNASTTKAPKTSSAANTKPASSNDQQAITIPSLHPLILAVVGGLGVLYAAYEYRQDVANKIYQFRRNRKNRRANRAPFEGR